ncbi:hypothetical protein TI39_contig281g00008 [Zymoseptoria brevis]|uniref:Uncharacterized protein n=1 Tax=Zymoseptoria brevis TaxID=1047168 RepID=A0A0F4GXE8_9PEZI|nr:hypothetical protein TI39_contig281g00008 [Zymoseptoria brevis]
MESTDRSLVGLDKIFRQTSPQPGNHNYQSPLRKMRSAGNFQARYADLTSNAVYYPTHAPASDHLPTALPGGWSRNDSLAPALQQQQIVPRLHDHFFLEQRIPNSQQQQLEPRPHVQSFREQANSVPGASSMDGSSRSPKEEESHEESREEEEPHVEETSLIRETEDDAEEDDAEQAGAEGVFANELRVVQVLALFGRLRALQTGDMEGELSRRNSEARVPYIALPDLLWLVHQLTKAGEHLVGEVVSREEGLTEAWHVEGSHHHPASSHYLPLSALSELEPGWMDNRETFADFQCNMLDDMTEISTDDYDTASEEDKIEDVTLSPSVAVKSKSSTTSQHLRQTQAENDLIDSYMTPKKAAKHILFFSDSSTPQAIKDFTCAKIVSCIEPSKFDNSATSDVVRFPATPTGICRPSAAINGHNEVVATVVIESKSGETTTNLQQTKANNDPIDSNMTDDLETPRAAFS